MDDNGSEEDYSYEDLCQANPRYLQPGGEQLAINEVRGPRHDDWWAPDLEGPASLPTLLPDYFLRNVSRNLGTLTKQTPRFWRFQGQLT